MRPRALPPSPLRPRTGLARFRTCPRTTLTPAALAERATEIAAEHDRVEIEVLDREAIAAAGMGGLVAVSQGTATDPRLISLRYSGGGDGPRIGLVGKAVTFDSGGISIKPSAGMHEMKFDMSGGAAVIEAFAAIAELGLELDLVAVVPATENMPSGTAIKPGDVITQLNGKTVEVNNTDAEGRLILADALTYARPRARRRAPRRPGNADRRGGGRARLDLRGADLQRRRVGGDGRRRGRRERRARLAPAAA